MDEAIRKEVEALIAGAVKGVADQLGGQIAEAVKPISGIAATVAEVQKGFAGVQEIVGKLPKLEDVSKHVQTQFEALRSSQASTDAAKAVRDRFAAELKGKGVAEELIAAHLPAAGDEAAMKAASEKAVLRWNELTRVKGPDVGGAARDGGTPPAAGTTNPPKAGMGLSDGLAKLAAEIKLPA